MGQGRRRESAAGRQARLRAKNAGATTRSRIEARAIRERDTAIDAAQRLPSGHLEPWPDHECDTDGHRFADTTGDFLECTECPAIYVKTIVDPQFIDVNLETMSPEEREAFLKLKGNGEGFKRGEFGGDETAQD